MYLHEAVSQAMATGQHIRRTGSVIWEYGLLVPTNSRDCCYLWAPQEPGGEPTPAPRWNPKAEDLIADDWVLVDACLRSRKRDAQHPEREPWYRTPPPKWLKAVGRYGWLVSLPVSIVGVVLAAVALRARL